jgi:hypothetical protein
MFTLGMATYSDFDGVYFTVQSARIHHPEITEIVIIDNNPTSKDSKPIKDLLNWQNTNCNIKYIPYSYKQGTSARDQVFKYASNEYVIVVDSHVLFFPDSIKTLKDFYLKDHKPYDFIQGPMIYDNLKSYSTHLDQIWRDNFYGTWATSNNSDKYFEIPSMGLGCFSCKKNEWLGFNLLFRGFGGEEGYIHEKYRKHGGRSMCLKDFKWLHRFGRPNGVPYKNALEDRCFNYLIGRFELGLEYKDVVNHFKEKALAKKNLENVIKDAYKTFYKKDLNDTELFNLLN